MSKHDKRQASEITDTPDAHVHCIDEHTWLHRPGDPLTTIPPGSSGLLGLIWDSTEDLVHIPGCISEKAKPRAQFSKYLLLGKHWEESWAASERSPFSPAQLLGLVASVASLIHLSPHV